ARPPALRPRALHGRGQGSAAAVRLLPVRGGRAELHRRAVRLDGGGAAPGHHRPTLAPAPRARPSRRASAAHHAAAALRDAHAGRAGGLTAARILPAPPVSSGPPSTASSSGRAREGAPRA